MSSRREPSWPLLDVRAARRIPGAAGEPPLRRRSKIERGALGRIRRHPAIEDDRVFLPGTIGSWRGNRRGHVRIAGKEARQPGGPIADNGHPQWPCPIEPGKRLVIDGKRIPGRLDMRPPHKIPPPPPPPPPS